LNLMVASIDRRDPPHVHALPDDSGNPILIVHLKRMTITYFQKDGVSYAAMECQPNETTPGFLQVTRNPELLSWLSSQTK